jgi:hypothetical protein
MSITALINSIIKLWLFCDQDLGFVYMYRDTLLMCRCICIEKKFEPPNLGQKVYYIIEILLFSFWVKARAKIWVRIIHVCRGSMMLCNEICLSSFQKTKIHGSTKRIHQY